MSKFKSARKARIFIVDESAVSLMTLATLLHREGFNVNSFTDGIKALKASRYHMPDLLIADASMSPFSGIEFVMRLRERKPHCKILLFSGWASAEALENARSNRLEFETILKPVDPKELIHKVREMTAGVSRSDAEDRVLQTYRENVQETL
jgi:two-component system response regulator ChvI